MIRFIGIDPGDVWVGIAALEFEPERNEVRGETRVYNLTARGLPHTVQDIVSMMPAHVAVENFSIRPQGHNRFKAGQTLRLIGALEYAISQSVRSTGCLIPPGNAEREVPLLFGDLIARWRKDWQTPGLKEWNHAYSAWRVLGRHLMTDHVELLRTLKRDPLQDSRALMRRWLPLQHGSDRDIIAPASRWTLPPAKRR